MGSWVKGIDAITLFVEDLPASKAFYQNVFGIPWIHEDDDAAAFVLQGVAINLLRSRAAHELIEPEAVGEPGGGSRVLLTVGVDDVDTVCAELASRGVGLLNGPMDRPWGIRTASFADPDGHVWEIAHRLPKSEE